MSSVEPRPPSYSEATRNQAPWELLELRQIKMMEEMEKEHASFFQLEDGYDKKLFSDSSRADAELYKSNKKDLVVFWPEVDKGTLGFATRKSGEFFYGSVDPKKPLSMSLQLSEKVPLSIESRVKLFVRGIFESLKQLFGFDLKPDQTLLQNPNKIGVQTNLPPYLQHQADQVENATAHKQIL